MKNVSTRAVMAVALAWGVSISNAALMPLGGEYPLLGNIEGHQSNPHVAVDSEGGFVVWQNASQSNSERILVQRVNSDYVGVGTVQQVSQGTAGNNDMNPRVAMLQNGGAAVVWEAGPRGNKDVYVRFINSRGDFTTGIMMANSHAASIQRDAAVAGLQDGGAVVVWESVGQDGSGEGIYGQRFNAQGIRVGSEFLVNQTTAANQSDPTVTSLNGGNFVVGWLSQSQNGRNTSGGANLRNNVLGRLYTSSGAATGNEYRLNDGDAVAADPQLATRPDGGFLLTWVQQDETNPRNSTDVYIKNFDANGLPGKAAARHNTHLTGRQSTPEVAMVGDDALVTWASAGQDAGGLGVQGRMLSGGSEFQVNSQGQLNQSMPTIGSDGAGKYIAVWVNTIRADHSILSAQRYLVPNGDVGEGVVDVTAGAVEIVGLEPTQRLTNPQAARRNQTAAAAAPANPAQDTVVTMQIPAPKPAPVIASVAPPKPTEGNAQLVPEPVEPRSVNAASAAARAQSGPSARMNQASALALQNAARLRSRVQPQRMNLRSPHLLARSLDASRNIMLQRAQQSRLPQGTRPTYGGTQMASLRNGIFNRAQGGSSAGSRAAWSQQNSSVRQPRQSPGRVSMRLPQSQRTSPTLQRSNSPVSPGANRFDQMRANARMSTQTSEAVRNRAVPASMVKNGRGTKVTWISQAGVRYQPQYSSDNRNWSNFGSPRMGNRAGFDSVSVNNGGHKYLRVVRTN